MQSQQAARPDSAPYFRSLLGPEEFDALRRYETMPELLRYAVAQFAAMPAFEWEGGEKCYLAFDDDVASARGFLCAEGLPAAARVGLLCPNDYDFARLFFAITTAGLVAVPLPPSLPPERLSALIKKHGLSLLLFSETLSAAAGDLPLRCVPASKASAAPASACREIAGDAPAALLFTDGSARRAALFSHKALLSGAYNGCMAAARAFFRRYVSVLPFSHAPGLVSGLLAPLCTGSLIGLCPDPQQLLSRFARVAPTSLVLDPLWAERLLSLAAARGNALLGGALSSLVALGAPLPPRLAETGLAMGIRVFSCLVLPEAAGPFALYAGADGAPAYMPFPDLRCGMDGGALLLAGEPLMRGYDAEPAETAMALQGGAFRTGLPASIDERGMLVLS